MIVRCSGIQWSVTPVHGVFADARRCIGTGFFNPDTLYTGYSSDILAAGFQHRQP